MRTLVVINPASARGKTGRHWPQLQPVFEKVLGSAEFVRTSEAGEATGVVRAALRRGVERVVSVGGDGTNHEVIQGFFDPDLRAPIKSDAVFAFVPRGTGGDLGRTFAMGTDLGAQLQRIVDGPTRRIDAISCEFTQQGQPGWRASLNAASFGQGGDLVHRVDRWKWAGGGGLPFVLAGIEGAMFVRPWSVELRIDDGAWEQATVRNLGVFNGRFQGGGMQFAPDAKVDDGRLELVALGSMGAIKSVAVGIASFWRRIDGIDGVWTRPAAKVQVRVADGQPPAWVELDGESPGQLPATFQVMGGAVRIAA